MQRRFEPLAGEWSLPGGALEIGETLAAGVAREMLEETGLVVEVSAVLEVFDRILLDEQGDIRSGSVITTCCSTICAGPRVGGSRPGQTPRTYEWCIRMPSRPSACLRW